jgi:hypothetical protein
MTLSKARSIPLAFALATACMTAVAGCGPTTFQMAADPTVVGAMGEVDASFEKDGNNKMKVKVQHLAAPNKLNASATTYVVWVKPRTKDDVKPHPVGVLKVNSDEEGSLEFSTPTNQFDITITPESSSDVTEPSGRDVLKATISGG